MSVEQLSITCTCLPAATSGGLNIKVFARYYQIIDINYDNITAK